MKQRLTGFAILLVCLLLYDFESEALVDRLLLPIAAAIGAWMMVKNAAAICIVAAFLGLVHTDLNSKDWVTNLAYPVLAAFSGACLLAIIIGRFSDRIAATHEARWQHRRAKPEDGE